jgi:hypothetical protein
MVGVARPGQRPYDNQATGGRLGQSVAYQMAKSPLHLITDNCSAHRLAHDETRTCRGSALPRRVRVRCTAVQMDDEKWASSPASSPYRGREVLAPPQPILGRQHVMTCLLSGDQADRRARPLPRRVARIARPARVRIRSRKPWVLARRRLFGWKVRLLTRGLQKKDVWTAGHRLAVTVRPREAEKLAITPECTASQPQLVIFAHRRQAAAAIDNSTWSRYARLRHPVKPAPRRTALYTACGQQLEPRGSG